MTYDLFFYCDTLLFWVSHVVVDFDVDMSSTGSASSTAATTTISVSKRKLRKRKVEAVKQGASEFVIVGLPVSKKHKHDGSTNLVGTTTPHVASNSWSLLPSLASLAVPVAGFPWTGKITTRDDLVNKFIPIVQWCEHNVTRPSIDKIINGISVHELQSSIHHEFQLSSVNEFAYLAIRLDEACHHLQFSPNWRVYVGSAAVLLNTVVSCNRVQAVSDQDHCRLHAIIQLFSTHVDSGDMMSLRKFPDELFQPLFDGVFTSVSYRSLISLCIYNHRLMAGMPWLMRLIPNHHSCSYFIWDFLYHLVKKYSNYYRRSDQHVQILVDTLNFIPLTDSHAWISYKQQHEFLSAFHDPTERAWSSDLGSTLCRFTRPIPWNHHYTVMCEAKTKGVEQPLMWLGARILLPSRTKERPCMTKEDRDMVNMSRDLYTAQYVTPYASILNTATPLTFDPVQIVIGYMLRLADSMFIPWTEALIPRDAIALSHVPFLRQPTGVDYIPVCGQVGVFKSSSSLSDSHSTCDGDVFVVAEAKDYPYSLTVFVPSLRKAAGVLSPIEFGRDRSVFALDDGYNNDDDDTDDDDDDVKTKSALYAPIVIFPLNDIHTLADTVDFPAATDQPLVDRPLSAMFVREYVTRMSASWQARQRHLRAQINSSPAMS